MCPDSTVARVARIPHSSNCHIGNTNGPSLRPCEGREHRGACPEASTSKTECGRRESIHGDDCSATRPSRPRFRAATNHAREKLGSSLLERKDNCYRVAWIFNRSRKNSVAKPNGRRPRSRGSPAIVQQRIRHVTSTSQETYRHGSAGLNCGIRARDL